MRKLKDLYPGQTDTATDVSGFPDGMAQNETSPGDRNGFPLEKEWVNDVWGFFTCLLVTAGLAPNNAPERGVPGSSQLVEAIKTLIRTYLNLFLEGALVAVDFTTDVTAHTVTTTGNLASEAGLSVQTDAVIGHDLTVELDATVERDLLVGRNAAITGDVNVTGTATVPTFAGPADFTGPVTVNALATVDTLIVNGTSTLDGKLFLGASSKIVERAVIGVDADHSYTPSQVDVIVIPLAGTLTADRTYTILDTGAVDGMSFDVANQTHGANHKITVTGANLDGSYDLGHIESFCYIKFTRIGGTWRAVNKVAPV